MARGSWTMLSAPLLAVGVALGACAPHPQPEMPRRVVVDLDAPIEPSPARAPDQPTEPDARARGSRRPVDAAGRTTTAATACTPGDPLCGLDASPMGMGDTSHPPPPSGQPPHPKAPPTPTRTGGFLSRAEVLRGLRAGATRFDRCLRTSGLSKRAVTLRFTIEADGSVPGARVLGADDVPDLARCIETTAATLRFPAPTGGAVSVTHPLLLKRR